MSAATDVARLDRVRTRPVRTAIWIRPERVKEVSLLGVIVVALLVFGFLVDDYFSGLIVAYGRVPAIITTLGTLAIYRSWLISHGEGRTITADSLPSWVVDLPTRTVFGLGGLDIRVVFAVVVVIVAVLQIAMLRLRRACPPAASSSVLSPPAAPCRGSPGSCSSPASATSLSLPAGASSWTRSQLRWWVASVSWAAPAPWSGRSSARS